MLIMSIAAAAITGGYVSRVQEPDFWTFFTSALSGFFLSAAFFVHIGIRQWGVLLPFLDRNRLQEAIEKSDS